MLLSLPLSLILLPVLCFADPLHLTLNRRASPVTYDPNRLASIANNLRHKYGYVANKKRASSVGISMLNLETDASYVASMGIGTPPQTFDIILDTGSSDLWVADSSCNNCPPSITLFDHTKSTSFNPSNAAATIPYGQGKVSGQVIQEVVNMSGLSVPSQTILAATVLAQDIVSAPASGLMGLAFAGLAATKSTPFWQSLSNSGQLASSEFAFQLTRERGNPNPVTTAGYGGLFTLGGTNTSLFTGSIEFLNIVNSASPTYWLLSMAAITVQGKSVPLTSAILSAIDTGTTLIGGPTATVQAIWAAVGGQPMPQTPGFFQYPCKTSINISISFGGQTWPIDPRDMNFAPVDPQGRQCVGAIFDLSLGTNIVNGGGNPDWVIGDTFLKNVYSVFRNNPPSVGFAQLSAAAGGSGAAPSSAPSSVLTNPSTSRVPSSTGAPGAAPSGTPSSTSTSGSLSNKVSRTAVIESIFTFASLLVYRFL